MSRAASRIERAHLLLPEDEPHRFQARGFISRRKGRSLSAREFFLLVVAGRWLVPRASDAARDAFNGTLRACVRRHPDWLMVPPVHDRRIERLLSPIRPAP